MTWSTTRIDKAPNAHRRTERKSIASTSRAILTWSSEGSVSSQPAMYRRLAKPARGELTLEDLILTRDWVRLRSPQVLAQPLPVVPVGAIGQVLTIGPTGALVRFRKYPATSVNFRDLERASFVDLLPIAAQPLARAFGGWVMAALGVAFVAAITAAITLLVERAVGK